MSSLKLISKGESNVKVRAPYGSLEKKLARVARLIPQMKTRESRGRCAVFKTNNF